ncbi:hypothetical protein [Flavilitoribacter nigricans]|uniref:Uncharacterized protein n=1 Tax=Flavilitoribacter nigricans (strain ATCC 23147 / DSM 23189 / NBRC 102662 / NCIMB 1420 / SS-2) TaxID=1122177 RepID=A0A2D0NB78_FLAN2|nr:hypothetical protein [Flavilitoribacter nigricans]PHN05745.1 hypothetical protein CRP01_14815 [Flavilitoribacter nigricans DSM 23189 = NBRC 102662]
MKATIPTSVQRVTAFLLVLLTLTLTSGCFLEYYKIDRSDRERFVRVVDEEHAERYFVVYQRGKVFQLLDPVIEGEVLRGSLAVLPAHKTNFVYRNRVAVLNDDGPKITNKQGHRYRPYEKFIIQAVHIYLKESSEVSLEPGGGAFVPFTEILQVHIYAKDKGSTFASHVFPVVSLGGLAYLISGAEVMSFGDWDLSGFHY